MKHWLYILLICLYSIAQANIRYEIKVSSRLVMLSEQIAMQYIGIVEQSPNRHPVIDTFNYIIGNPLGSSYCQAGQYYTYWMAYRQLYGREYINYPVPQNGLAISTFILAQRYGVKAKKYFAQRHDFIIWKAKNSYSGHIERVKEVFSKGWVKTIGFNVSYQNREGIFYRTRNIRFPLTRIKVIRGIVGIVCTD